VVDDQVGSPTYAPNLAGAILEISQRILDGSLPWPDVTGVYHAVGSGSGSWADVAQAVFDASAALRGPCAEVVRITTAEYPTRAVRPANSCLSTDRLQKVFGVSLPPWREAVIACTNEILTQRSLETP
jgi:dTDP-4-dehydrorhamnose reductase